MKRKILNIVFMLLAVLSITACTGTEKEKESEEKVVKE